MAWKPWIVAASIALPLAFLQEPRAGIAAALTLGFLLLCGIVVRRASRAVFRSDERPLRIASGLVMATILALPMLSTSRILAESLLLQLVFLPAYVLAGLMFGVSYAVILLPAGEHPVVQSAAAIVFVGSYWLVATAILAKTIMVLRRLATGWVQTAE